MIQYEYKVPITAIAWFELFAGYEGIIEQGGFIRVELCNRTKSLSVMVAPDARASVDMLEYAYWDREDFVKRCHEINGKVNQYFSELSKQYLTE